MGLCVKCGVIFKKDCQYGKHCPECFYEAKKRKKPIPQNTPLKNDPELMSKLRVWANNQSFD